jgi:hypothetical protein
MTSDDAGTADDVPTWAALFERAPPALSETTVRETLAARRHVED